jgi:hypothetical protein
MQGIQIYYIAWSLKHICADVHRYILLLAKITLAKLPFWRAQIHSKPADAGYSNILHCLVATTHLRQCPPVHSTFGRDNLGTIIGIKLPFRQAQIHSKPADAGYSNLLHCMVAKTHLHRCPPVHCTFGRDNFGEIIGLKLPFRLNTQPEQTGRRRVLKYITLPGH